MCSVVCLLSVQSAVLLFFFFFQAEDGIRDLTVTGVQTCALPISIIRRRQFLSTHLRGAQRRVHQRLETPSLEALDRGLGGDRKSTRLNSSHSQISYAVFCLKKKKETDNDHMRWLKNISLYCRNRLY